VESAVIHQERNTCTLVYSFIVKWTIYKECRY